MCTAVDIVWLASGRLLIFTEWFLFELIRVQFSLNSSYFGSESFISSPFSFAFQKLFERDGIARNAEVFSKYSFVWRIVYDTGLVEKALWNEWFDDRIAWYDTVYVLFDLEDALGIEYLQAKWAGSAYTERIYAIELAEMLRQHEIKPSDDKTNI